MKILAKIIFGLLIAFNLCADDSLLNRASAHVGGMYLVMGYGFSTGLSYERVLGKNMALSFDANYNTGAFALGAGPFHSAGLDVNFEYMPFSFDSAEFFSNGIGFALGLGNHYSFDFNNNIYFNQAQKFGSFATFTVNISTFIQHFFYENFFFRAGLTGNVPIINLGLNNQKSENAPKIIPKAFLSLGFAF